jgi:hypothetical protein
MTVASLKNPSKADSEKHLLSMAKDMGDALTAGGGVYSTYSNAKIGGAIVIENIKAASWTPTLAEEYKRILIERGWKENRSTHSLCRDGMLARIDTTPSTDSSNGSPQLVYGFAMSYSLRTRRICAP